MSEKIFQDYYPDDIALCYGCGRHNEHGHHVRTYWNGQEGTATFMPEAYHIGFPKVIYGGLLASLIDCHAMGVATAAACEKEGLDRAELPQVMHVTANMNINYLRGVRYSCKNPFNT